MPILKPRLKNAKHRVSLNWTQLHAVTTGVSAIDLGSLAIRTRDQALQFAKEYGFDIDNPIEREQIAQIHREAIQFIETYFLEPSQYHLLSEEVRNPDHILDLLVYSSNYLNKSNLQQLWACAVLKVMHGLFHIDHDYKLRFFDQIRKQIFESLDKIIISGRSSHYLTGDQLRIPLFFYEKKRNKDRHSVLLKLLQKPSYVASDIYDHLGIRLIFETKTECLFALKILRRSHLIAVTNIKPFRCRNNLLDMKQSRKIFTQFRPLLARSKEYPLDILKKMDEELDAAYIRHGSSENPHSSKDYQAIHLTVRKMIRVPNPAYLTMRRLMAQIEKKMTVPPQIALDAETDKEFAFYFDYEIQLMDRKSYLASMRGPASHKAYKQRQRETARTRVLGPFLIKHLKKMEAKTLKGADSA